jgi:hypothetical protein
VNMKLVRTLALVLASCTGGRSYATRATYDAPKSGFRMIVDAVGSVPPGEDLGAGISTVLVCPRGAPSARELRIDLSSASTAPRSVVAHDGTTSTPLAWDFKASTASLTRALAGVGFTPDAAEVEEAVRTIEGVGEGPKGTPMPGQTHALTVVTIDFDKSRGSSHCAP